MIKRAILLDDEQSAIDELQDYLQAFDFIKVVDTFKNLEAAEKGIIKYKPDLLFLDIRIKGEYVFKLLEKLRQRKYKYSIIFVSGYFKEHVFDVMESCNFSHFDYGYLHKPIDRSLLEEVLHKFQNFSNNIASANPPQDSIIIRDTKHGFTRIKFDHIIYFSSNGNHVNVYYRENGKLLRKVKKTSLSELEKVLPNNDDFFRISHAAIINSKCFYRTISGAKKKNLCVLRDDEIGILGENHHLNIPEDKWKLFRERFGF